MSDEQYQKWEDAFHKVMAECPEDTPVLVIYDHPVHGLSYWRYCGEYEARGLYEAYRDRYLK